MLESCCSSTEMSGPLLAPKCTLCPGPHVIAVRRAPGPRTSRGWRAGQEKRLLPSATHTSCTIEMLNTFKPVDVAVIDEIQASRTMACCVMASSHEIEPQFLQHLNGPLRVSSEQANGIQ